MTLPCILYNCFVFALFFILKILDLRAYHKIGLMNKISKTHCIVIDAILTAIILCVAAFLSAIVFLKPDDGYSFPLSFLIIPWSLACLLFALSLFVERRKSMTIEYILSVLNCLKLLQEASLAFLHLMQVS